jgi:type IV secretion system protein TrbL
MSRRWILFAVLLLAGPGAALAQTAGVLDAILSQSSALTGSWIDRAINLAQKIFGALVVLEFVWFGAQTVLKKSDLSELFGGLAFKVVAIGFFYTLIQYAPSWIPAIQQSFLQAGATISGLDLQTFTPSRIINYGVDAAGKMLGDFSGQVGNELSGEWWNAIGVIGRNLLPALIMVISAFLVVIAFAIIAIQFIVTMLESYLVIGAGAVMLGFSGSRWTMNFAEKYLSYAMSVGGKLIVVTMLVGFGQSFADGIIDHWTSLRQNTGNGAIKFGDYLAIAGGSLVFSAMSYMLPSLAGSMLNGVASMSLANTAGAASSATMPAVTGGARVGATAMSGTSAALTHAAGRLAPTGAISGITRAAGGGGGGDGSMAGATRAAFGGGGGSGAGAPGAGAAAGASAMHKRGSATVVQPHGGAQQRPGQLPGGGGGAQHAAANAPAFHDPRAAGGPGAGLGGGAQQAQAQASAAAGRPDAGWRDYRDEERDKQREMRARASAGKFSRALLKAADKASDASDAMSAFARRNRRPLQSDGHVGAAPGMRMRIDD